MSEFKNLTLDVADQIAVLAISRPAALNALNSETLDELNVALTEIEARDDVKVLILTGGPDKKGNEFKSFVAGADIAEMAGFTAPQARAFGIKASEPFFKLMNMRQVTIAAVNGFALGGGCEISMACDIRIASENAIFGQPETGLGIIPGFGGTQRLARLVGMGRAKEMIFTCDNVDAAEAYRIGLVNKVVAKEELMPTAKAMAAKIISKGSYAIAVAKAAINNGYDMDIIPSDLATYGKDAKALLKELQSQNERMFLITFLIMNTGSTEQELENNVFQASSIAQKHNCNLRRLDFQQEQGLMSSLPLAQNQIEIQRGLTTSSTAIFVPFTTQELFQDGKEALYYGLNALSNNLIMVDRKKLKNPNGLILGTPGSGKSFSAKREIANAFLVTDDDVIICDPEAEYTALVQKFNGQVIELGPSSNQFINPMDINANYSEEDNPIALKADFIISLCELIAGGKEGLQPIEKTVIDRCVRQIYQEYFKDPRPENMPILEDLYDALLAQEEKEARRVATALEIYVKGSLSQFNRRTNVDITNRLVSYNIKGLGKQMKKIGMLAVQDQVWGRVTANRNAGKVTRYYMDEFHLLLKEEQTAAYSVEIWKRFRKWGGIPTGITQNVKDLLSSREVENIFENSDFIYMLNQASGDRAILSKQLNISPHQLSYVTHSGEGEGLLFYGNVILPFVDHFPKDLELYRYLTTKLSEVTALSGGGV